MLGIRASAKCLRRSLRVTKRSKTNIQLATDTSAMVAHAIYERENAGQSTTLRQVHHIVDIGQPEALRLVRELETRGLVVVTDKIHDPLDSTVELTHPTRKRITRILGNRNI